MCPQCNNGFMLGGFHFLDALGGLGSQDRGKHPSLSKKSNTFRARWVPLLSFDWISPWDIYYFP